MLTCSHSHCSFNPAHDEVHQCGLRLEAVFDSEWAKKPDFANPRPAPKKTGPPKKAASPVSSSSSDSSSDSDSDSDDSDAGDGQVKLLQNQLNLITAQLTALVNKKSSKSSSDKKHKKDKSKDKERRKREKRERKERERAEREAREARERQREQEAWERNNAASKSKTSKSDKKKKSSMGGSSKHDHGHGHGHGSKASGSSGSKREITLEDKQFLTEQINNLEPQYLTDVVTIIQQNMPQLANTDSGEIELDIDTLDQNTLRKLYDFVIEKNRPAGR